MRIKLLSSFPFIQNKEHGKIYYPLYYTGVKLNLPSPDIRNAQGQKYAVCFLRDMINEHNFNGTNEKIYWERYNFTLPIHLYTHECLLHQMGSPTKKYGMLCESRSIVPYDYQIFNKHKNLDKDFDLIFTFDEHILNKYSNARFAPATGVWYGLTPKGGGTISDMAFKYKHLNISFISSNKHKCDLHIKRIKLAKKLKSKGIVDCYGNFDGSSQFANKAVTLENYRYQIVFENDIAPYYFTEKILDCFASMTVPIYIGATQISNFFNSDGIIQMNINALENIQKILANCTEQDYYQRLPAILDNYERVKEYYNISEYLYDKYIGKDFIRQ